MRVALVSLARRGGMLHFQADLANSMGRLTPTVAVRSRAAKETGLTRFVAIGRVDTGRSALGSLLRALNPLCWREIRQALRDTHADVIQIVGVHEWNPLVGLLVKSLGKPLVYTVHDPEPHAGAPLGIRTSNWITARLADALVVLTKHGRNQLVSQGFRRDAVYYIPYGISFYFADGRRRPGKAQNDILCFGRIEPYKGIEVLVDAYRRVREVLPDWTLTIAGSGALPASLSNLRDPGIKILNKYIRDDGVARLMQRARMVVAPYLEATQSAVIATAYGFGRPVIASRVGGLEEMVISGKTGVLVPPHDAPALAKAILSLAADQRRLSRLGRNARAFGTKKWSWTNIARQHLRMYGRVLSKRGHK